jgi:hypothetical protein
MTYNIENLIKETEKIMPSEDLIFEVLKDLMKDEVKGYIQQKIKENPEIKKTMDDAMLMYINAKIKEIEATTLLTKAIGELGIVSLPADLKKEFVSNIYKMFQKEIEELLEKTI